MLPRMGDLDEVLILWSDVQYLRFESAAKL